MNLSIWEDSRFNPVNFQPSNRGIYTSKALKLGREVNASVQLEGEKAETLKKTKTKKTLITAKQNSLPKHDHEDGK